MFLSLSSIDWFFVVSVFAGVVSFSFLTKFKMFIFLYIR